MKKLIMVHGDKGGTGKTHVAHMTAAFLRAAEHPVTLIDGDAKNPGLHRIFDGKPHPVLRINTRKPEGIDALLETYLSTDQDVLIDLPAGGSDTTRAFVGKGSAAGTVEIEPLLKEVGGRLVIVFVIDQSWDSIVALDDEFKRLPAAVTDWFIVRNQRLEAPFDRFQNWSEKHELGQTRILDIQSLDRRLIELMVDAKKHIGEIDQIEEASALTKMRAKSAMRDWAAVLRKAGLFND